MWNLEYKPQRTRPTHPMCRERQRRKQAERSEDELLTVLIVLTMILLGVTAVALHAAGWM